MGAQSESGKAIRPGLVYPPSCRIGKAKRPLVSGLAKNPLIGWIDVLRQSP